MVQFKPFAVEQWMDEYELSAKYNIAETCCASISVEQLQELSDSKRTNIVQLSKKLTYGDIRGSPELRGNIARLYSSRAPTPLPSDNVLITNGAIAANFLFLYSFVGPGDHVICHHPTYQQLYSVPASLGAEVDLWHAKPEAQWVPDIEDLKSLIKPNTKLIIINNPNNPSGAVLKRSLLEEIINVAKEKDITILSDEVYRPIFHSITPAHPDFPPSMLSLGYKKAVVTGSLSKAYSLAGIRLGWMASHDKSIIDRCASARDYTTISVGQIDDQIATAALDPDIVHNLLGRNIQLARTNLEILEKFIMKHDDICEWVKPLAGTTAFVRFHRDGSSIDAVEFCKQLHDKSGVMFVPGDLCFGDEFKGYVRIGFVQETQVLKEGLEKARLFLRKEFDDLPLSK